MHKYSTYRKAEEGRANSKCAAWTPGSVSWRKRSVCQRRSQRRWQPRLPLGPGGAAPRAAARAACKARRVARLVAFHDPDGNRLEAVLGVESAVEPFTSPCFAGPFGNATGFGHAVLVPRDLAASQAFYAGTLGFGISARLRAKVGPLEVHGIFLHCNRRHHSLALMALPQRKKLHHVMLEACGMADVVRAHERARAHGVPLSLNLGQHPDPDGTLSFYGRTPSGFDFKIGAGGREIQPLGWRPLASNSTSTWGHKPTLGLQLRAAHGRIHYFMILVLE